jgi:hypothetical protein
MPLIFLVVFMFTAFNLFDRIAVSFGSRAYIGDRLTAKGAQDRLRLFFERFEKLKDDLAIYMNSSEDLGLIHMDGNHSQITDEEKMQTALPDTFEMQLMSERK